MRSRPATIRWAFASLFATLVAGACVGNLGGVSDGEGVSGPDDPDCAVDITSNASVMEGLRANCEACHNPGSNKPFFGSVAAFEALLVYNPEYVIAGDPEGSYLVQLMRGDGTGTFTQMPTAGASFKDLAEQGATSLSMEQLSAWIADLPEPMGQNFDALKASTVRRMSAEQLLEQFNEPLGLTDEDMFNATGTSIDGESLPARSPDALGVVDDYTNGQHQVYPRFLALGGPHHLQRRLRSKDISPTLLQSIVQMSQARCRKAVLKENNTAFFRHSDVRENIAYLHLRILGEVATDEDIDALHQGVFLHYEAASTESAWTATCAALLRHPLAMTY